MKNLNAEMNEKAKDAKSSEELLELAGEKSAPEQNQCCAIEDDSLENVSGGLVQLINPSSSRL